LKWRYGCGIAEVMRQLMEDKVVTISRAQGLTFSRIPTVRDNPLPADNNQNSWRLPRHGCD
jgi:hypothetical protein